MIIHSFIQAISIALLQPTAKRHSRHSTDTVLELHSKAPTSTASEGFAQGPYGGVARVGFEPHDHLDERRRIYKRATTPHNDDP